MRLLRCERAGDGNFNITLEQFTEFNTPPYIILSHRWGRESDEVSFQDISNNITGHREKLGYAKILACCRQALRDNCSHIWIDTCCIDKTSSSELSEGINSMYNWYGRSISCYAYLADVASEEDPQTAGSSFRRSGWFSRGWTLQELIAPTCVVFFSKDWIDIGTKTSLAGTITEITDVEERALVRAVGYKPSIAKRMSWASNRKTTRIEDRAYSLMGIFGVNLPVIYGEGERSFMRLQKEIMTTSCDHSIFAWEDNRTNPSMAMLASSPDHFSGCSKYSPMAYSRYISMCKIEEPLARFDYCLTNLGLRIGLPIVPATTKRNNGTYLAFLACLYDQTEFCFIQLLRTSTGVPGHMVRVRTTTGRSIEHSNSLECPKPTLQQIFVAEREPSIFGTIQGHSRRKVTYRFLVNKTDLEEFRLIESAPTEQWPGRHVFELKGNDGSYGVALFRDNISGEAFAIVLGVHNSRVWSDLLIMNAKECYQNANEVYAAYNHAGKYGDLRWNGIDWVKKPRIVLGKHVVLTVRKESESGSGHTYLANIMGR